MQRFLDAVESIERHCAYHAMPARGSSDDTDDTTDTEADGDDTDADPYAPVPVEGNPTDSEA